MSSIFPNCLEVSKIKPLFKKSRSENCLKLLPISSYIIILNFTQFEKNLRINPSLTLLGIASGPADSILFLEGREV